MTNQPIDPTSLNNSAAKNPPSKRVYAFSDLSKETQERFLKLQNSDGDFLRLSNSVTAKRIILLILLAFGFAFFLAAFENVTFDLKWILVFSGGTLIFALCFIYCVWGILKTIRSPIKNRLYLTPTQVIEMTDGKVRCRDLKDAAEIVVNGFWTDIGRQSSLIIKFADGDFYQYKMPVNNNSAQLSQTRKWQEKAMIWRDEAVSSSKRGDTAYPDFSEPFSEIRDSEHSKS